MLDVPDGVDVQFGPREIAPEPVRPLRQFYLCRGAVGPLDSAQFAVLPAVQKKAYLDEFHAISQARLPAPFQEEVQNLRSRLLNKGGSVE